MALMAIGGFPNDRVAPVPQPISTAPAQVLSFRTGGNRWNPASANCPPKPYSSNNEFIHGDISRRAFMEGVQRIAGGLAVGTIVDALMPNYALGQQVSRTMIA